MFFHGIMSIDIIPARSEAKWPSAGGAVSACGHGIMLIDIIPARSVCTACGRAGKIKCADMERRETGGRSNGFLLSSHKEREG